MTHILLFQIESDLLPGRERVGLFASSSDDVSEAYVIVAKRIERGHFPVAVWCSCAASHAFTLERRYITLRPIFVIGGPDPIPRHRSSVFTQTPSSVASCDGC